MQPKLVLFTSLPPQLHKPHTNLTFSWLLCSAGQPFPEWEQRCRTSTSAIPGARSSNLWKGNAKREGNGAPECCQFELAGVFIMPSATSLQ